MMKQVMAHELVDLSQIKNKAIIQGQCAAINPILLARLIATIRHLRVVVRRQRDAMRP
jgi:hypothetical protein